MNFEEARNNMVLNQLRANRISNSSLIEKIEYFPRENLFPSELRHLSYSDKMINLECGRFILPPLTSFHLLQSLGTIIDDCILEIGSGFGTTTSILSQFTSKIDCIESSEKMIENFKKSLNSNLFNAELLNISIDDFFEGKNLIIKKYDKILINGSLDQEPHNIINKSNENSQIVCIIDNKELKHKVVKYDKVNGNCNRFIIDEASSNFIYKYIKKEPFVF